MSDQSNIDAFAKTSERPVVMQVVPALETGGVERGTVDVAAALTEAGWRSLVVSSGGRMVREILRVGAEHIELPVHSKNPMVMRGNAKRLSALIREKGVDIVHARSRAPAWSARRAARRRAPSWPPSASKPRATTPRTTTRRRPTTTTRWCSRRRRRIWKSIAKGHRNGGMGCPKRVCFPRASARTIRCLHRPTYWHCRYAQDAKSKRTFAKRIESHTIWN